MVNIINLFRKLHRNTYWLMKKHSCLLEVTRQWYKSFRLLGIFSHNDLASANKRNYDNKLLPKELANLAGERIKKKKKKTYTTVSIRNTISILNNKLYFVIKIMKVNVNCVTFCRPASRVVQGRAWNSYNDILCQYYRSHPLHCLPPALSFHYYSSINTRTRTRLSKIFISSPLGSSTIVLRMLSAGGWMRCVGEGAQFRRAYVRILQ